MTLETQVKSGIRWTSLSAISTVSIESIRLVVLARFLSPADFGLMAMAMVVIGLAEAYTDLGISGAIIHRQDATKEQLSSLYWLNVLIGFVAFSLVWLCIPLIVSMFREPRLLPILHVVAVVFLIAPAGKQFEILLQKELKFDVLAKRDVVAALVGFVVAIASAVSGFGVWALVHSLVATVSLKTIFLFGIGWTRYRPHLHFRRSDLKGFLAFGLYQLGERSVNHTSERLDQLLIGTLLGAQALGLYNFANNLTAIPIVRINPIITKVAFPMFAKIQNDTEALRKGYLRLVRVLTTINAPLLFGIAAVAPLAVPMIFGEKWSLSIELIQVLSILAVLRSTGNPIGSLQLAKGRADLGFKWNIIFSIVCAPAILAGAILGQSFGVAISLLIVQVVMQVPGYLFMIRPLVGSCAQEYGEAILKPIALAGAMGLIVIASSYLFAGVPQVPRLIAVISIGASLYLVLLRVFDKEGLYGFRRMLFAR